MDVGAYPELWHWLKNDGVDSIHELEPPPQALSPSVEGSTMAGRLASVAYGAMLPLTIPISAPE